MKLKTKKIVEYVSKAINYDTSLMVAIKNKCDEFDLAIAQLEKKKENEGMLDYEYKQELSKIEKEQEEFFKKHNDLFYYYEGLKGAVDAMGYHAAGIVGSPISINDNIGLRKRDKGGYITSCDMKAVDSLNYVKYDILSLKTLSIIKETYAMLGRPIPRAKDFDWNDKDVLKSMGISPIGLFQFESDASWDYLKRFDCQSVKDIAFVTAVIRPSCASFREKAIARELHKNPNERIDEVLKDSLGYLVYQEQQILFLQKMCGFTEGEADVVRRAIGKGSQELLDEWLPKIEQGYINNSDKKENEAREEFQEFLKVFMDAVNYSFSFNHAIAYSMITYMTAYIRHHHTIEFITAYLNNAADESDIIKGTELAKKYNIQIVNPKFGISQNNYSVSGGKIVKGIGSILYISKQCAEKLNSVYRQHKDSSFPEIVFQCLDQKVGDSRQLRILAKLDYFNEYGKNKTIYTFVEKAIEYLGKKQIKKEGVPKGTEKIIQQCLQECVDNFSETAKIYKIDSREVLRRMWKVMPQIEYTKEEDVINQLSYLGYIQDKTIIEDVNIATVVSGKSRYDSFKVEYLKGGSQWLCFKEYIDEPKKGDIISIKSMIKEGRNTYVVKYTTLELDRKKQK